MPDAAGPGPARPSRDAGVGPGAAPDATPGTEPSPRRRAPGALIVGAVLVALVVLTALVSLVWTPYDPVAADASQRLLNPSGAHWFGTDKFGRDVASQLMAGSRITLVVAAVSVGIAAVIGVPLGILAGMRRGWAEAVILRVTDLLLAFPALLLAIVFAAVFGAGTVSAMVAIGLGTVPGIARVTRAGTLTVMQQDYIAAARSGGRGWAAVAVRHVLPNVTGVLVVQCAVTASLAVLAEAALSYLGLGTPPPDPSWGRLVQEMQQFLSVRPLQVLFPGAAIALTVLGFNLLGDGLRQRLNRG